MRNNYRVFLFSLVFLSCNTGGHSDDALSKDSLKHENLNGGLTPQNTRYGGPRYSIHQSNLAAKGTFKLDSYKGIVYQMVEDSNKNTGWQRLRRQPFSHFGTDSIYEGRVNYQLFLSTLAMKFTYLINVNTGATWELVEDPQTLEDYFTPVDSQ